GVRTGWSRGRRRRGRRSRAPSAARARADRSRVTTFRVLGPLEVVREGRRTRPAGKPAAVLVALLLRRGEVVPAETLLGDVWEDRPPQSAAKLLQAHVSQLRKLLGRNRLQTVGSGYVVAAEPEDVDLGIFELRLREAE